METCLVAFGGGPNGRFGSLAVPAVVFQVVLPIDPNPPPLRTPAPHPVSEITEFPVLIAIDEFNMLYTDPAFGRVGDTADLRLVDAYRPFDDDGEVREGHAMKNGMFVGCMSHRFGDDDDHVVKLAQTFGKALREAGGEGPVSVREGGGWDATWKVHCGPYTKNELKACLHLYEEHGLLSKNSVQGNDTLLEFVNTTCAGRPHQVATYCLKSTKFREFAYTR